MRLPTGTDFLTQATDPILSIDACPGAPFCAAATVSTRDLARTLHPVGLPSLHISGCAKGCARAKPATVTLVGRNGRFDVVRLGTAWDMPVQTGLTPQQARDVIHAS